MSFLRWMLMVYGSDTPGTHGLPGSALVWGAGNGLTWGGNVLTWG